jgi:hypothetical protein
MEEQFKKYTHDLIFLTFGFEPLISVTEVPGSVIQITLDGTEHERQQMMGRGAANFQALKLLLRCFARRNGFFSYLYIKHPDGLTHSNITE